MSYRETFRMDYALNSLIAPSVLEEIDNALLPNKTLVVYNDDFNTFPDVINCLIHYCGHELTQAEQCALIIHNNGKCGVKSGEYDKLKPICEALLEHDLTARIE